MIVKVAVPSYANFPSLVEELKQVFEEVNPRAQSHVFVTTDHADAIEKLDDICVKYDASLRYLVR